MRNAVFCAALAGVLAPYSAGAQSLTLTESEALARLSGESPRVRAIRAEIDVARADVETAGRWPNPRLLVDRESVTGITEYLTRVGQTLPISGQRGLHVRAASAMVDASTGRADDAVRRARADLRLAFAQLLGAQSRERELAAALGRLRGVADVLAKREAAGDAAGFDRLRADREVVEIDTDRSLAASDRARAQAALAGFFAQPGDVSAFVAAPGPASTSPIPALEELLRRAESTRGELIALGKEREAADFSVQAAQRRWIPEPEVVAGTKSSSFGDGDIGSIFGVQATIPLFDRGQPERALAQARGSMAEARAAAFRLALRAEIAGWRTAVLERRRTAEQYRTSAGTSVDQIERIAQVSYDAGERGILELLDAYRTGATSRIRQAALDAAVREAEIELEFVSGWEIQ
jgi:cobalt-zinc-cadmium efflux system outer membrane protein